jgi:hypothetical protein
VIINGPSGCHLVSTDLYKHKIIPDEISENRLIIKDLLSESNPQTTLFKKGEEL